MKHRKSWKNWKSWLSWGVCWALAAGSAWGAMGGVGREGEWALEIYANAKEVERGAGTWKVQVPKDLEGVLAAVGAKSGTTVRLGERGRMGELLKTERKWRGLELTFRVPASVGAPRAVEHFQMVPWAGFRGDIREALLAVAKEEAKGYGAGLGAVLGRMQTVFGGAAVVEAFPGTPYAKEFERTKKSTEAVVRAGFLRGWTVPGSVKERYRALFGEEWPQAAAGVFWSADADAVYVKEVRRADGTPVEGAFPRGLPARLDGETGVRGVFPAGEAVQFRYGTGEGMSDNDRVVSWAFPGEGSTTWFALHAGEGASAFVTKVENQGAVAVQASVTVGKRTLGREIPAGGSVALCLMSPGGVAPQFRAVAAGENGGDYAVQVSSEPGTGNVTVRTALKAHPELVLSNPEIMPVEVDVMAERTPGRFTKECHVRLKAGEMGYGIPAPPHKALELRCQFESEFHKAGRIAAGPLGYGDRTNVVLRAERKKDPEATIANLGTVALAVTGGITGPSDRVTIAPGKRETVTVAAGRRATLTFEAAAPDYEAAPLTLSAMAPGERRSVTAKATLKPAPQVVLENERGMMDVEATLATAAGKTLGRPVKVKRGKRSEPIPLPTKEKLLFRLHYDSSGFTATGTLAVPPVPRGETKTLVVPNPQKVGNAAGRATK